MPMTAVQTVLIKISAATFACATIAILALAVSPGRAATNERLTQLAAAAAPTADVEPIVPQDRFVGAPDGVDPVVTGPVSASFRKKQIALGCDRAVWPHIPVGCYPD